MAPQDSSEGLLGLDLGAAEIKIALYEGDGAPVRRSRAPIRGNPLESLLQLPFDCLRDAQIRVGVTGVSQTLLDNLPVCLCVNEVVATASAVRRAFPDARTVIDLGGQFSKWDSARRGSGRQQRGSRLRQ